MADVTPDLIFQVANGFMAAKHLFVANEIGLFEALADAPATLDDLAQRTGIPRRTLRILADAMVALGFLERQGDLYQNSLVAVHLSERSDPCRTYARPCGTGIISITSGGLSWKRRCARKRPSLGSLRSPPRNNSSTRRASKRSPQARRGHWPRPMISSAPPACWILVAAPGRFYCAAPPVSRPRGDPI